MQKYSVAVLGGGFAGTAAALASARQGAKTIIIEKGNCFGGAAVNALVNPFMPYWTQEGGQRLDLAAGIFKEIHDQLQARNALYNESFLEETLKLILSDMLQEAGADMLLHAYLCKAKTQEGRVESITVATQMGLLEIQADYFIDATGDAQLAYLSGCPVVLGRETDHLCQPMTLCFRLGNVDTERFFAHRPALTAAYAKAHAAGQLTNPYEQILVFRTPVPNVLHFNTTRVVKKDPTSPVDVTAAEVLARKQVYEIYGFMKQHAQGLENSFLMMTASQIGVRESRRIIGDYVLTEQDCRAFTQFDDAIAACNYDIDIHNPEGSGTSHYYFPQGKYYTIPYRSLIPQTVENMLVAGRCISSDHGAQASYRIMPTVCCLGQAAGTAAALAAQQGGSVRRVDVRALQGVLKAGGGFIGSV